MVSTPAPARMISLSCGAAWIVAAVDLGGADDEDAHVGHGPGQRVGRKVAADFDLEVQFFEFGYGAAGELVDDQDFHDSTLYQFGDSKPAD